MARKAPIVSRELPTAERQVGATERVMTFGEAFTEAVIDVVRPLMTRLPGTVIPTDGPAQEAIEAVIQQLLDQVADLRREVDQLRMKGRRVPSKETLFEERMNTALRESGVDRKTILRIWKNYQDLDDARVGSDAKRQRRSRAARRFV